MNPAKIFTAAAVVGLAQYVNADVSKVETKDVTRFLTEQEQLEQRELLHFTVIFEECVGKTLEVCKGLIQAEVTANPSLFENREHLDYDVKTIRASDSSDYHLVGMRTNEAETHVVGVLGNGMVFYPWDWCTTASTCYAVGPWDCDVGIPLPVEDCCNMIKSSVPYPDLNGNLLDCYVDPPVGSVSNPTDYGRVSIHVNGKNIVIRAPKNE